MDTGSGHIFEQDKIDIKSIKGKLVPWKVGEKVVIKDCQFEVTEIRTFPKDEIVLKGEASTAFDELKEKAEKIPKENQHGIMDFVRKKK